MINRIRNRTLAGSYDKQYFKYLPELIKIFHRFKMMEIEEITEHSKYTKRHTTKLVLILKELGWICNQSTSYNKKKKVWKLTPLGKQLIKENINDSE